MASITFDTLKFSKRLKDAGVPDKQAEAEAEALSEVFEINFKEMATKEDLKALEERLSDRMTMLEQRMTIKLGALMVAAVGIVAILVKLL